MDYEVDLVDTPEVLTAVVRDTIPLEQISARIIPLFDLVYAFLPEAGIDHPGLNIILYRSDRVDLEAGVQVEQAFQDSDTVKCSALPAGRAAHAVHYGAYNLLGEAHRAVRDWCRESGLKISNVSWEVYGHWHDVPPMLRTDVYYLLQGVETPQPE
jgi:effector-binding domain-containing protein